MFKLLTEFPCTIMARDVGRIGASVPIQQPQKAPQPRPVEPKAPVPQPVAPAEKSAGEQIGQITQDKSGVHGSEGLITHGDKQLLDRLKTTKANVSQAELTQIDAAVARLKASMSSQQTTLPAQTSRAATSLQMSHHSLGGLEMDKEVKKTTWHTFMGFAICRKNTSSLIETRKDLLSQMDTAQKQLKKLAPGTPEHQKLQDELKNLEAKVWTTEKAIVKRVSARTMDPESGGNTVSKLQTDLNQLQSKQEENERKISHFNKKLKIDVNRLSGEERQNEIRNINRQLGECLNLRKSLGTQISNTQSELSKVAAPKGSLATQMTGGIKALDKAYAANFTEQHGKTLVVVSSNFRGALTSLDEIKKEYDFRRQAMDDIIKRHTGNDDKDWRLDAEPLTEFHGELDPLTDPLKAQAQDLAGQVEAKLQEEMGDIKNALADAVDAAKREMNEAIDSGKQLINQGAALVRSAKEMLGDGAEEVTADVVKLAQKKLKQGLALIEQGEQQITGAIKGTQEKVASAVGDAAQQVDDTVTGAKAAVQQEVGNVACKIDTVAQEARALTRRTEKAAYEEIVAAVKVAGGVATQAREVATDAAKEIHVVTRMVGARVSPTIEAAANQVGDAAAAVAGKIGTKAEEAKRVVDEAVKAAKQGLDAAKAQGDELIQAGQQEIKLAQEQLRNAGQAVGSGAQAIIDDARMRIEAGTAKIKEGATLIDNAAKAAKQEITAAVGRAAAMVDKAVVDGIVAAGQLSNSVVTEAERAGRAAVNGIETAAGTVVNLVDKEIEAATQLTSFVTKAVADAGAAIGRTIADAGLAGPRKLEEMAGALGNLATGVVNQVEQVATDLANDIQNLTGQFNALLPAFSRTNTIDRKELSDGRIKISQDRGFNANVDVSLVQVSGGRLDSVVYALDYRRAGLTKEAALEAEPPTMKELAEDPSKLKPGSEIAFATKLKLGVGASIPTTVPGLTVGIDISASKDFIVSISARPDGTYKLTVQPKVSAGADVSVSYGPFAVAAGGSKMEAAMYQFAMTPQALQQFLTDEKLPELPNPEKFLNAEHPPSSEQIGQLYDAFDANCGKNGVTLLSFGATSALEGHCSAVAPGVGLRTSSSSRKGVMIERDADLVMTSSQGKTMQAAISLAFIGAEQKQLRYDYQHAARYERGGRMIAAEGRFTAAFNIASSELQGAKLNQRLTHLGYILGREVPAPRTSNYGAATLSVTADLPDSKLKELAALNPHRDRARIEDAGRALGVPAERITTLITRLHELERANMPATDRLAEQGKALGAFLEGRTSIVTEGTELARVAVLDRLLGGTVIKVGIQTDVYMQRLHEQVDTALEALNASMMDDMKEVMVATGKELLDKHKTELQEQVKDELKQTLTQIESTGDPRALEGLYQQLREKAATNLSVLPEEFAGAVKDKLVAAMSAKVQSLGDLQQLIGGMEPTKMEKALSALRTTLDLQDEIAANGLLAPGERSNLQARVQERLAPLVKMVDVSKYNAQQRNQMIEAIGKTGLMFREENLLAAPAPDRAQVRLAETREHLGIAATAKAKESIPAVARILNDIVAVGKGDPAVAAHHVTALLQHDDNNTPEVRAVILELMDAVKARGPAESKKMLDAMAKGDLTKLAGWLATAAERDKLLSGIAMPVLEHLKAQNVSTTGIEEQLKAIESGFTENLSGKMQARLALLDAGADRLLGLSHVPGMKDLVGNYTGGAPPTAEQFNQMVRNPRSLDPHSTGLNNRFFRNDAAAGAREAWHHLRDVETMRSLLTEMKTQVAEASARETDGSQESVDLKAMAQRIDQRLALLNGVGNMESLGVTNRGLLFNYLVNPDRTGHSFDMRPEKVEVMKGLIAAGAKWPHLDNNFTVAQYARKLMADNQLNQALDSDPTAAALKPHFRQMVLDLLKRDREVELNVSTMTPAEITSYTKRLTPAEQKAFAKTSADLADKALEGKLRQEIDALKAKIDSLPSPPRTYDDFSRIEKRRLELDALQARLEGDPLTLYHEPRQGKVHPGYGLALRLEGSAKALTSRTNAFADLNTEQGRKNLFAKALYETSEGSVFSAVWEPKHIAAMARIVAAAREKGASPAELAHYREAMANHHTTPPAAGTAEANARNELIRSLT